MPIAQEKYNGESGSLGPQSTRELAYIVTPSAGEGFPSLSTAITTALQLAPATVTSPDGKTLVQIGISFDPVHETDDGGVWEITVRYGDQELSLQESGTTRITFDTTGGTQKITQSKATISVTGTSGALATNFFKGSIGNDGENVEGVDVTVPVFRFTVTKVFEPEDAPSLTALYYLTGTVNAAAFTVIDSVTGLEITLQAGEGKFDGARGGEARADGMIEIAYSFEASPNATGLTIGDITGINKKGWEYLWVRYLPTTAGTGADKVMIQKPVAAAVERVYDSGDWTNLKLSPT